MTKESERRKENSINNNELERKKSTAANNNKKKEHSHCPTTTKKKKRDFYFFVSSNLQIETPCTISNSVADFQCTKAALAFFFLLHERCAPATTKKRRCVAAQHPLPLSTRGQHLHKFRPRHCHGKVFVHGPREKVR